MSAGGEDAVEEIEVVLFVRETFQGRFGFEVEAESAFGTWFADASEDSGEGFALEVAGELFDFALGERGEGGLDVHFSFHKPGKKVEEIRDLGRRSGKGRVTSGK